MLEGIGVLFVLIVVLMFLRVALLATWESFKNMSFRTFKIIVNLASFLFAFFFLNLSWWGALLLVLLCHFAGLVVIAYQRHRFIASVLREYKQQIKQ